MLFVVVLRQLPPGLHFTKRKRIEMKRSNRVLLAAIGLAAATGIVIYMVRRHQTNGRFAKVAEEGYETAHDILYPDKRNRRKKVHYGPVLPE